MATTSKRLEFSVPGGLTLAAQAWGNPEHPCVLLLHNLSLSSAAFETLGRALAEVGRYVVALDLRGHGESSDSPNGYYTLDVFVDDLSAVLQALPSRPVIIGSSLGGLVAMAALGEGKGLSAQALIVVGTTPWTDRSKALSYVERFVKDPGPYRWDKRLLECNWPGYNDRIETAAKNLKLPVMLIRGEGSDLTTSEQAERFASLGDNFSEFDIQGAGHYIAEDNQEAFLAVVTDFLEREAPRSPLTYQKGADSRTLRDALGAFATGVTVITSKLPDGRLFGMTANSFTSVSLDPPLILFCPAKSARSYQDFMSVDAFAVNVLHIGQQPTSGLFASPIEDRFSQVSWETWDLDVPIISGSLASFECRKYAVHDAGDHAIVIGEVVQAQVQPQRDPLAFFRGKYRRLHFD